MNIIYQTSNTHLDKKSRQQRTQAYSDHQQWFGFTLGGLHVCAIHWGLGSMSIMLVLLFPFFLPSIVLGYPPGIIDILPYNNGDSYLRSWAIVDLKYVELSDY